MSSILSKCSQLAWLFIPPLCLFLVLGLSADYYHQEMTKWLTALPWLNYVTLLIAAGIALQFGRSRLVYCCILLALFLPAINQYLSAYPLYFEVRQYFLLLAISWLMLGRDRGFSRINILFSAITWLVIALISWLISTQLVDRAVPLLAPLQQPLASLIPQIGSQISVFEYLFFCLLALIGFGRFMYKCDNNHNALFITLLLIVPLQLTNDAVWMQLILLCLTALYCYAVIKDSFTMAFKDELTTIPSRRALMQYVQTLGRKYTVVMSDIDHFKKFNDTYGHDVGDEVLKLVASKLYKVTGGGKAFRFGGEEFVIIFPRKNTQEVVPYVELVRQTIANYDIALRAKPRPPKPTKGSSKKPSRERVVKVTTSFGIAQRTKTATDFSQVMKQADLALYAAKKAGRNCVKIAQQP